MISEAKARTAQVDSIYRIAVFDASAQRAIERNLSLVTRTMQVPAAFLRLGTADRHVLRCYCASERRVLASAPDEIVRLAASLGSAGHHGEWDGSADGETRTVVAVPLSTEQGEQFGLLGVVAGEGTVFGAEALDSLRMLAKSLVDELRLRLVNEETRQREAQLAMQRHVLRLLASGAPLKNQLRVLVTHLEQQSRGLAVLRLITSDGGRAVTPSPNVPKSLRAHIRACARVDSDAGSHAALHGFAACSSAAIQANGSLGGWIDIYHAGGADNETSVQQWLSVGCAIARIAIERRRSDARLRRSEVYHRSLIENSSDLIFVLSPQGEVHHASPSAREVLLRDGAMLASLYGIMPGDEAERLRESLAQLAPDNAIQLSLTVTDGQGRRRELLATATNLLANPAVAGLVLNARDVTERRELEEKLRQSQRMEAIGLLAGGVAHDFNNILTVISGCAAVLEDSAREDAERETLGELHDAVTRAASLTRQLLAFSRRQVLQPRAVDLAVAVTHLSSMLRRLIGANITLQMELHSEAGSVYIDPGQLEQIIMNLVVNARDALPNGGQITVETAPLADDRVRLTVSDNGVGMSAETLARAFEPFFTTKAVGKGTGLGLSTVHGIVEQSGGEIAIRSEPGRGTRVELVLPRSAQPASGGPNKAHMRELPSGSEAILVVEDDAAIRALAPRLLTKAGYRVKVAEHGDEAMQVLHAGFAPDLLLTDVVLPGMSGDKVADAVRAHSPATAIVFMSGYTDNDLTLQRVRAGDQRFVQKPFDRTELLRVIRATLDARPPQVA